MLVFDIEHLASNVLHRYKTKENKNLKAENF